MLVHFQSHFSGGQKTGKLIWVSFLPTLATLILKMTILVRRAACFLLTTLAGGSPPIPSKRFVISHESCYKSEQNQSTADNLQQNQVHHRKNKTFEIVTKDIEARTRKERDEPRKRVFTAIDYSSISFCLGYNVRVKYKSHLESVNLLL